MSPHVLRLACTLPFLAPAACSATPAARPVTRAGDAGFTCTPTDGSTHSPIHFTGTRFDPARGCLAGKPVSLPVCGCFDDTGKDSSTWCFVSPDGTAYFATSADQCAVDLATGWYATQSFGTSPFGTGSSTQAAACASLRASSTAKGSYDMPAPPACTPDGGAAPIDSGLDDAVGACTGPQSGTAAAGCTSNSALVVCATSPTSAESICLNDHLACAGAFAGLPCGNACTRGEYAQECSGIEASNAYPPGCHAPLTRDNTVSAEAFYMCCPCSGDPGHG